MPPGLGTWPDVPHQHRQRHPSFDPPLAAAPHPPLADPTTLFTMLLSTEATWATSSSPQEPPCTAGAAVGPAVSAFHHHPRRRRRHRRAAPGRLRRGARRFGAYAAGRTADRSRGRATADGGRPSELRKPGWWRTLGNGRRSGCSDAGGGVAGRVAMITRGRARGRRRRRERAAALVLCFLASLCCDPQDYEVCRRPPLTYAASILECNRRIWTRFDSGHRLHAVRRDDDVDVVRACSERE